jgi:4-hydroxy-tetrahydrodipicolinate reductase
MNKVIVYGFGSLGRWSTEVIIQNKKLRLTGVIDNNPQLVGKDAGRLLGIGNIGIRISSAERLLRNADADVVIHSTITSIEAVSQQLLPCLEKGMNVISTSEELIYPWKLYPDISQEIDLAAKLNDASVIATGVNPGFTTDLLPLVLCGASERIDNIKITRVVDFSEYPHFRPPYMGFGMSHVEFEEKVHGSVWDLGRNPLPGREQNIQLIADSLDWELSEIDIQYESVVSESKRPTKWGFEIEPGQVAGVTQIGRGFVDSIERITIESTAICHPDQDEDNMRAGNHIQIKGNPSHDLWLDGGTVERGGYVSSARQVNLIPYIVQARSGLLTMRDLPAILPTFSS